MREDGNLEPLEQAALDDALGESGDEDAASLRGEDKLEYWREALLSLREQNEAEISRLRKQVRDSGAEGVDPLGSTPDKALREAIAIQHALQERLGESREIINARNRRIQEASDPKALLRQALPYLEAYADSFSDPKSGHLAENIRRYLRERGG